MLRLESEAHKRKEAKKEAEKKKDVELASMVEKSLKKLMPSLIENNSSFDAVLAQTFTVTQDPASPFSTDFYRSFHKGTSNIYLLGSNNIVQIYQKAYPNAPVQNYTDYNFSVVHPYTFVDLSLIHI